MRFLFRKSVLLLLVIAVSASAATAEPIVTEETQYYDIEGSSTSDLRNQMNSLGIKEKDGKTYDGYTNWHISWKYRYMNINFRCMIKSVATTVKITYLYPRWTGRSFAPRELTEKWDRFMSALIQHEQGHRNIAVEAASRIEEVISRMTPRTDCRELDSEANAQGYHMLEECKKSQANYDAVTSHGRLQGVRFP